MMYYKCEQMYIELQQLKAAGEKKLPSDVAAAILEKLQPSEAIEKVFVESERDLLLHFERSVKWQAQVS